MARQERLLYQDRIIQDPNVMVGKPVVKGTRIPVERVIAHLGHNLDLADLFGAYPELTVEDVKACLQYALAALQRRRVRAPRTAAAHPANV